MDKAGKVLFCTTEWHKSKFRSVHIYYSIALKSDNLADIY